VSCGENLLFGFVQCSNRSSGRRRAERVTTAAGRGASEDINQYDSWRPAWLSRAVVFARPGLSQSFQRIQT
jgi:hypothetical protein